MINPSQLNIFGADGPNRSVGTEPGAAVTHGYNLLDRERGLGVFIVVHNKIIGGSVPLNKRQLSQ